MEKRSTILYKELKNAKNKAKMTAELLDDVKNSIVIESTKGNTERFIALETIKNRLYSELSTIEKTVHKYETNYRNALSIA